MPRLRQTDQQRREKALELALARARVELDLPLDKLLAAHIGMHDKSYSYHKHNRFLSLDLEQFGILVRRLGLTAREVCDILGVPWEAAS